MGDSALRYPATKLPLYGLAAINWILFLSIGNIASNCTIQCCVKLPINKIPHSKAVSTSSASFRLKDYHQDLSPFDRMRQNIQRSRSFPLNDVFSSFDMRVVLVIISHTSRGTYVLHAYKRFSSANFLQLVNCKRTFHFTYSYPPANSIFTLMYA